MNERFGESHYTYCMAGDGCLQEGVALEALAIAGLHKLNKFILLYDQNNATLDGKTTDSSTDNIEMKFKSNSCVYDKQLMSNVFALLSLLF